MRKEESQQVFRDGLLEDLAAFQDGCDQFDDITMLLLDYKATQG